MCKHYAHAHYTPACDHSLDAQVWPSLISGYPMGHMQAATTDVCLLHSAEVHEVLAGRDTQTWLQPPLLMLHGVITGRWGRGEGEVGGEGGGGRWEVGGEGGGGRWGGGGGDWKKVQIVNVAMT